MNYAEYAKAAKAEGLKPLSMKDWATAQAEGAPADEVVPATTTTVEPDAEPEEVEVQIAVPAYPEPDPEDRLIFQSVNRYRRETVQAGQKIVINNQIVVQPHRDIAFNEYHWAPDMQNPDEAEKALWLKERVERGVYNGEIIIVPEAVTRPPIGVRTGPRTSGSTPERVQRPQGPLSAALPE